MKKTDLNRRDFNRLSMAAFGGVVAGSLVGCGGGDDAEEGTATTGGSDPAPPADPPDQPDEATGAEPAAAEHDVALLMEGNHVCRGLNTCENKGGSGENACAGQGTCHTLAETHDCHAKNQCKGEGGCGEFPGQNACSEQGECGVPLSDGAWAKARAAFEAAMADADKDVGAAPDA